MPLTCGRNKAVWELAEEPGCWLGRGPFTCSGLTLRFIFFGPCGRQMSVRAQILNACCLLRPTVLEAVRRSRKRTRRRARKMLCPPGGLSVHSALLLISTSNDKSAHKRATHVLRPGAVRSSAAQVWPSRRSLAAAAALRASGVLLLGPGVKGGVSLAAAAAAGEHVAPGSPVALQVIVAAAVAAWQESRRAGVWQEGRDTGGGFRAPSSGQDTRGRYVHGRRHHTPLGELAVPGPCARTHPKLPSPSLASPSEATPSSSSPSSPSLASPPAPAASPSAPASRPGCCAAAAPGVAGMLARAPLLPALPAAPRCSKSSCTMSLLPSPARCSVGVWEQGQEAERCSS